MTKLGLLLSFLNGITKDKRQKQFIKELSKSCNKWDSVIYCLVLENNIISFCISLAVKWKNSISLRWLTLIPDNKDLEEFYIKTFDFTQYKAKKDKITYLFIAV